MNREEGTRLSHSVGDAAGDSEDETGQTPRRVVRHGRRAKLLSFLLSALLCLVFGADENERDW